MPKQNEIILDNRDQTVALMEKLFFNEKNHIARQVYRHWLPKPSWGYKPEPINGRLNELIAEHLKGKATYGLYSHSLGGTCKWICIDIDLKHGNLMERGDSVATVLGMVVQRLMDMGIPDEARLMEFSGSKGFHVWVLLPETPMASCQNFIRHFLNGLDKLPYDAGLGKNIVDIDKFPNPSTHPSKPYGYAVKIPCGLHQKVGVFSSFIDINRKPIADVPQLLESVVPCRLPDLPIIHETIKPKHAQKPKKPRKRKNHDGDPLAEPPITEELNTLMTECKFLKQFRARPDLARHGEWTHAGQLLVPLGQSGADWFAYLSSVDERRYDGSHQQLIDNITDGGLSAPTCGTIGCDLCDNNHAYQLLDRVRRRYELRYKTENKPIEEIDLMDLRPEYERLIKNFLMGGSDGVALSNMPVGGYKSTTAIAMIEEQGLRSVYYCPNHDLAQDIANRLHGKAVVVLGLDRMLKDGSMVCPYGDDLKEAMKFGRSTGEFCNRKHGKCDERHDCPYLKQFRRAARAKTVILVHDHLHLGHKKMKQVMSGKQIAVLDESFHRQYRTECTISPDELECLRQVLRSEALMEPIKELINPLMGFIDSDEDAMVVPSSGLIDEGYLSIDRQYKTNHPTTRNPLRDLIRAGHDALTIRKTADGLLSIHLPATLPQGIPVLILDATARPEDYERLLGRPVETINPAANRALKQYAETIQVVTGSYPNSSLIRKSADKNSPIQLTETGERIIDHALNQIRDHDDYGIICTKSLEKHLIDKRNIPPERVLHYNLLRGTNVFRDVLDLIVIGYQGISYEEMAKSSRILFDQGWDDQEIARHLENERSWQPIGSNGSHSCRVKFLSPKNPFIDSFHRLCVIGEIEQAVGRARIYSPSHRDRRVHIITSAPTNVRIDRFVELSSKSDPIEDAVKELLLLEGSFTFKSLYDRVAVDGRPTKKTVRNHLKRLVGRLNLHRSIGEHNCLSYSFQLAEAEPHSIEEGL